MGMRFNKAYRYMDLLLTVSLLLFEILLVHFECMDFGPRYVSFSITRFT